MHRRRFLLASLVCPLAACAEAQVQLDQVTITTTQKEPGVFSVALQATVDEGATLWVEVLVGKESLAKESRKSGAGGGYVAATFVIDDPTTAQARVWSEIDGRRSAVQVKDVPAAYNV